MSDLETIYNAITAKAPGYARLEGYYHGNQPAVFLTERLREIFRNVNIQFTENWCAIVVDSCAERIELSGFDVDEEIAKAKLSAAWERNSLAIESDDVHTTSMVVGECYAIVWPDEDGLAEVYYNSPSMVHAVYSGDNPRKIAYAGKMFNGNDKRARVTLYYPDRLEYYIAAKDLSNISNASAFQPDLEQPEGRAANPYGKIPVFHFKNSRLNQNDLASVIPLQNGINKLLSDMIVAAEYGAFSQRWIISNADNTDLKNAPDMIWNIPAGDGVGQQASVGQFQPTDLKNYLDAVDRLSSAIGVITRTPKHYFFSQGGDLSGEALIAMEAPLNHKAASRIARFITTWRELAAFVCQIEGVTVLPADITPAFEDPETVQPATTATITQMRVASGVPLTTALRWEGKTDAEIEQMQADQNEAKAAQTASLASALMEAERQSRAAQEAEPQTPPAGQEVSNV